MIDLQQNPLPLIIGFVAPSGTGKTTLIENVIQILRSNHLNIGIIKHAHHEFDIDVPGKDSYRLRKAGALQTMITSKKRWALINEINVDVSEPDLIESLKHMDTQMLDLIIVEGFKHEDYPKIILHRSDSGKAILKEDENTCAYATNQKSYIKTDKPILDINNPQDIVSFIKNMYISAQTIKNETEFKGKS